MRSSAVRRPSGRLGGTAAAGPVLAVAVLVAGVATPGYSQFRDTVSLLEAPGQPVAALVRVGLVTYGSLLVWGARDIRRRPPSNAGAVCILIRVYGLAAIVTGVAPKDPTSSHAPLSTVHVDATIIGGAGLLAAMVIVARSWPDAAGRIRSTWAAGVGAGGVVLFRFVWGSPVYGLVERALLVVATWWVASLTSRPGTDRTDGPSPRLRSWHRREPHALDGGGESCVLADRARAGP